MKGAIKLIVLAVGISPLFEYFPAHSHEIWEIVLNQQGEGYMIIGDKKYTYGPGTIICLPPNITHAKYSNGLFRDIHIKLSTFSLSGFSKSDGVLVFQDDSEKTFESLLLMANRIYHKNEKNSQYLVIEQLKNAIIDSFTDPEFSITELLSKGSYCIDHLRRLFKQSTGYTPLAYLTELRLNNAKNLMLENKKLHYTISEISVMSGFYDCGYFSRVFKKNFNITPTEYLKLFAN